MKLKLKTTAGTLTFYYHEDPAYMDKYGPSIIVLDNDYKVCSYLVETLRGSVSNGAGLCITRGRFETYRALEHEDLQRLMDEVDSEELANAKTYLQEAPK